MTGWDEIEALLGPMKRNAPATDEELAAAQRDLGVDFPADYIEFLEHANGAEGTTTVGGWLWLYPLGEVVAATRDLWSWEEQDFRPLVVLASDGGEEAYVLDPRTTPPQIYEWELFSPEPVDGRPVGSRLRDLLLYARNVQPG